jgi:hypothetical protein
MKLDPEQLKLLGLSRKEVKVLEAVWKGKDTPLLIARETSMSRPATYEILGQFKKSFNNVIVGICIINQPLKYLPHTAHFLL